MALLDPLFSNTVATVPTVDKGSDCSNTACRHGGEYREDNLDSSTSRALLRSNPSSGRKSTIFEPVTPDTSTESAVVERGGGAGEETQAEMKEFSQPRHDCHKENARAYTYIRRGMFEPPRIAVMHAGRCVGSKPSS